MFTTVTVLCVLVAGFLLGIAFPALYRNWRTPPSGNQLMIGAVGEVPS